MATHVVGLDASRDAFEAGACMCAPCLTGYRVQYADAARDLGETLGVTIRVVETRYDGPPPEACDATPAECAAVGCAGLWQRIHDAASWIESHDHDEERETL